jgi:CRISPR-associated endonuclease/helicase Cas3
MEYERFFGESTGLERPYPYQVRLAMEPWPDVLNVPTGLGKTSAVTLAWIWKRGWRKGGRRAGVDSDTPRRLVWCLPMRVLVDQTATALRGWLNSLEILGEPGEGKISIHLLMGGEPDLHTWAEYPEEDAVLVGTQDMLLSRALMRGYGMSRYLWPVHFALLHNDTLWVFDEVQLMGAGLATSAQLEAFRRRYPGAKKSRSLWISATLNRDWLSTVDFREERDRLKSLTIGAADRQLATSRLRAVKRLTRAPFTVPRKTENDKTGGYLDTLCKAVLEHHRSNAQTLVILNRVNRAQELFRRLQERRPTRVDLLLHARFRPAERARLVQRLHKETVSGRIVVATQAVEAGVDLSARTLITELAPWTALVQRFGRCNRYGEYNDEGADILWIDFDGESDPQPYTGDELRRAREQLSGLEQACPEDLSSSVDEPFLITAVLRKRDLWELFNTDPDLSGFDVDVSDYVRDSGVPHLRVFWRDFEDDPNEPPQGQPERAELCPVSLSQLKALRERNKDVGLWIWDALAGRWKKLTREEPMPGMTLLLRAADGGYHSEIGFDASCREAVPLCSSPSPLSVSESYNEDWRSRETRPVFLVDHLHNVADQARKLCQAMDEEVSHAAAVVSAARWHDLGKAHEVFDKTMHACPEAPSGFLAKSPCTGRHERPFFRHELASMLGWLTLHEGEPDADLIAYLIAAHHGKVRMSLRALPDERPAPDGRRFARGIWEGDKLPALTCDGENNGGTVLALDLMEVGRSAMGRSWIERTQNLLASHGPFKLAWLETLVRIADWRASRREQGSEAWEAIAGRAPRSGESVLRETRHFHPGVSRTDFDARG